MLGERDFVTLCGVCPRRGRVPGAGGGAGQVGVSAVIRGGGVTLALFVPLFVKGRVSAAHGVVERLRVVTRRGNPRGDSVTSDWIDRKSRTK